MKSDVTTQAADNGADTICAISTPPGVGGIAVIRVSGPRAMEISDRVWEGKPLRETPGHKVRFGRIIDPSHGGELLDEGVATVFRAPASFTGEDVVELSVHGSRYVQRRLLEILVGQGARLADAGEFTRRAFANGKLDLAQAEAVADVIASNSRAAHRLAASQMKGAFSRRLEELRGKLLDLASLLELELDFSEEEVEFASRDRLRDIATEIHSEVSRLEQSFSAGSAIKNGIPVAIIGPTNAGKSSLLNLLLGEDRAIVSDIHGTTRDTIEDTLEIGDYLFRFIDTAGMRDTTDPIEALGIQRSRQARDRAAIIIQVVDATNPDRKIDFTGHSSDESQQPTESHYSNAAHSTDETPHTQDSLPTDEIPTPTILLLNKADLLSPTSPQTAQAAEHPTPYTLPKSAHPITSLNCSQHHTSAHPTPVKTHHTLPFSTKTGQGHKELLNLLTTIADTLRGNTDEDTILVTNLRHVQALREAGRTTAAILDGLRANLPGDLIAQDLRATLHHLSTITGTLTTPDILASIFSRFCIGK